jgi:tetratricopeptide (TPR) repeat protein
VSVGGRSEIRRWLGRHWPFWLAAVASVVALYSGLAGGFVYDDTSEILSNELIRDPRHLGRALVSDTWAFRATTDAAYSSYWRPSRTLWVAMGYRLFGVRSALGWHLGSLALHLGALAAAQTVLRRLGASPALIAAILLLFAIHPTRVESVTWISAFQDPLSALFLLGSLAIMLGPHPSSRKPRVAAAVALFLFGLLSKEAAIAFPAVVFVALLARDRSAGRPSWRESLTKAATATAPFLLAAAAYLVARKAVLGVFTASNRSTDLVATLLTLPAQFTFYLSEALFPVAVGPVHPLRVVRLETVGFGTFWLPAAVAAVALGILVLLSRRSPLRSTGLALFLFLLAPSLPASNLPADRIVQDRYLYLPLLGLLAVLLPALEEGLKRLPGSRPETAGRAVLGLAVAAALPLGLATSRYAPAWGSDAAIWEWGVRTDPGSPFALAQHAAWLQGLGRNGEAKSFADRALQADPAQRIALLTRARIEEAERRLADAERDYRLVLKLSAVRAENWDEIAAFYLRNGKPEEAVRLLRIARDRLPRMRAAFTDNMAAILHDLGRTDEALRELEAVRPLVRNEFHPASPSVLFHIGVMNLELGRLAETRSALVEFLGASERADNPEILRRRGEASQILARLPPTGGRELSPTPSPAPAN